MDFTDIRLSGKTRREHDLLGEMEIPAEYYFGVQTMRAVENFHISRVRLNFFPELIHGLADVKQGAAMANRELGLLDPVIADAIIRACEELRAGKLEEQFVVDMVQGGAGTSTNMNANEVIANRALELLRHEKGAYKYCHPNNHVNLSQSTNDAYPTAVKIALVRSIEKLVASLRELIAAFPEAEADLLRRLELARAMSVLVPPVYTRSGTHQNKLVRFLAHSAWPPERPVRILLAWLTMMRRMGKFADRFFPEAEVVIFGHLHRRAVSGKKGRRLYVNLGACFRLARCWAADVTPERGVSIRSYTPGGYDGPEAILR